MSELIKITFQMLAMKTNEGKNGDETGKKSSWKLSHWILTADILLQALRKLIVKGNIVVRLQAY